MAPVLAALYPVLSLYTESAPEANMHDAVACGIVIVAGAIVVAYLFRSVFSGTTRASLAAVLFIVWTFAFSTYVRVGRYIIESVCVTPNRDYYLYTFWILLLFPALFLLRRFRCSDHRMAQLL